LSIGIASHTVLDSIQDGNGIVTEHLGGPPCYCGLTSKRFGFDVSLATKVGRDFPAEKIEFLNNSGLKINNDQIVDAETTRFFIMSQNGTLGRQLFLRSKCQALSLQDIRDIQVDCWLVSPVVDEIPSDVLQAIVNDGGNKNFVMLDPQGYMRIPEKGGSIKLHSKLDLHLSGINAIKVDTDELMALTETRGVRGMQILQKKGIEFVISTEWLVVHLLHRQTHFWIKTKQVDTLDSTGGGDILTAAFCCAYIKEKDPLWALCFAAGSLQASLETRMMGLLKIPSRSKIEENASYYYSTVEFDHI